MPTDQRIALAEALGLDVLDEERRLPMIVHRYIDWLWERRETRAVVHPWLVEARAGLLRS